MAGTRMFGFITETWNPITGCLHDCYNGRCWARIMCNRFGRRWGYGFQPTFHPERLNRKFKPDRLVFTVSMGDLFGSWVKTEHIKAVLDVIDTNRMTRFFLETKNPRRYLEFEIPENTVISTTIETNRSYSVSKAPPVHERYSAFKQLGGLKHVSVEPIMDFDLDILVDWIGKMNPSIVSIGYDNYGAGLPEPPVSKTVKLIEAVKDIGIAVEVKSLRKR